LRPQLNADQDISHPVSPTPTHSPTPADDPAPAGDPAAARKRHTTRDPTRDRDANPGERAARPNPTHPGPFGIEIYALM
jgi:hypothetical protein